MNERTKTILSYLSEIGKYVVELDCRIAEYTPSVSDTVEKILDGISFHHSPPTRKPDALQQNISDIVSTTGKKENEMMIDMPGISMCKTPRKDGRYQGHVTKDGVTKYLYGKSLKDLYDNIQRYVKSGYPAPKRKTKPEEPKKQGIIFNIWINKWLELYKKPNVKLNTYNCLIQALKKPLEKFGDLPIETISTEELQVFFLSYTALRLRDITIATLKMAFEKARKLGLIIKNPMDGVEISPKKYVHRNALTVDEQQTVLSAVKGTNYDLMFNFLVSTGLRIGEALALTIEDVDFEKRTVSVTKTAVMENGKKIIQNSPKTAAGMRIVPVPTHVLSLLKDKSGQIFPQSYNSVRLFFKRLSKKIKIKVSPHILRHTYATRIEEAGISPRLKQYLMGHASLEMTQNTYTDIQKSYIDKVNSEISSIFLPRPEE